MHLIPTITTPAGDLVNASVEDARAHGASEEAITAALDVIRAQQSREVTRAHIEALAGDLPSLLGTTSDVAALALIGVMQLVILITDKGSEAMKAGLADLAIPMPVDKARTMITAIASGQIKVPALVKGLNVVYAEVATRATATAQALIDVAPKG